MFRPVNSIAALAFVGALLAAQAGATTGLVTRTSKESGSTVKVPATWAYRDATYPSDHSTEFWTDPADPKSRLELNVSGCIGCVKQPSCMLHETDCGPDPAAEVPHGTLSKRSLGKWAEEFVARVPGSPYLDRGLVVIGHSGSTIRDWAYVELWLPASRKQLAGSILAGFRL
jgi:hypothetical protein